MKQKRQNSGLVQANDLRVGSAKRPISGSRSRELHGKSHKPITTSSIISISRCQLVCMGLIVYFSYSSFSFRSMSGYDGPMQFLMSPVNPDQVIPLQTNRVSTYDGKLTACFHIFFGMTVCVGCVLFIIHVYLLFH